jgi:hypothetical protein
MALNLVLSQYQSRALALHLMASQLRVGQKIALAITALAIVLVLILVFLSVAKQRTFAARIHPSSIGHLFG